MYSCKNCTRRFGSPQALGGHASSCRSAAWFGRAAAAGGAAGGAGAGGAPGDARRTLYAAQDDSGEDDLLAWGAGGGGGGGGDEDEDAPGDAHGATAAAVAAATTAALLGADGGSSSGESSGGEGAAGAAAAAAAGNGGGPQLVGAADAAAAAAAAAVVAGADARYRVMRDLAYAAGFNEAKAVADAHPLMLKLMEWKVCFDVSAGGFNALMQLLRDTRNRDRNMLLHSHFSTFKTARKWVYRMMEFVGSARPQVMATSAAGAAAGAPQQRNVVFSLRDNLYSFVTNRKLGVRPFVWGPGAEGFGSAFDGTYGNPAWSSNVRAMNKIVAARFEARHPLAAIQAANPGKRILICLAPLIAGMDDTTLGPGQRVSACPVYLTVAALTGTALARSSESSMVAGLVDRSVKEFVPTAEAKVQAARAYQASLMTVLHGEFADVWENPVISERVVDLEGIVCVLVPYIAWFMGDLKGMNELRQLGGGACPWCLTFDENLMLRRTTDDAPLPFPKRNAGTTEVLYNALHSAMPPLVAIAAAKARGYLEQQRHTPDVRPDVLMLRADWTPYHELEDGMYGAVRACALHNGPLGPVKDVIYNFPQWLARQSLSPAEAAATAAEFAAKARKEEKRREKAQLALEAAQSSDSSVGGSGSVGADSSGEGDAEEDADYEGPGAGAGGGRGKRQRAAGGRGRGRGGVRIGRKPRRPARLTSKSTAGAAEKRMLNAAIATGRSFADGETLRGAFAGAAGFYGRSNLTGDDIAAVLAFLAAVVNESMIHDLQALDDHRVLFGLGHELLSLYRRSPITEAMRLRHRDCSAEFFALADKYYAGYPGFIKAPKGHVVNVHDASVESVCYAGPHWQTSSGLEQLHKDVVKPGYARSSRKKGFLEEMGRFIGLQYFFRRDVAPLSATEPHALRSHPRSYVHPAAVCDDAMVSAFGVGAVAQEFASYIVTEVNGTMVLPLVRLLADGKTIVPVVNADPLLVGTALYKVAQARPTLLMLPRAVSWIAHTLAKPKGTLAELAWATTPAGLARLAAAFDSCQPPRAPPPGAPAPPLLTLPALALCPVYEECAFRSGPIDVILRPGALVELAIDGHVLEPNKPALVSCGSIVGFFTARVAVDAGGASALQQMPTRAVNRDAHAADVKDAQLAYVLLARYSPTTPGSAFATATRYTISAVAPRQMSHAGHVECLEIAQIGAIRRPLRELPVRYGGSSGYKQPTPCPTGFQHPGRYELSLSVYS